MATQVTPQQTLRVPVTTEPDSGLGAWLKHGGTPDDVNPVHGETKPWYAVLWLTGVDYFSTLGYQPGIALLAAGALSPIATLVLVAVTLFGALPMYAQVATRSYTGQGSIAMLEALLRGWKSKFFMLVLLGFAATGFIITMTLSAADAAKHIVENPYVERYVHGGQVWLTLLLLALLAAVFLKGFTEAIGLAVAVGVPYIILNLVVVARCFMEISENPAYFAGWQAALTARGDWTALVIASALVFPRLALGLSGFETGVAVMPLVRGNPEDAHARVPLGRIRNAQKLLAAAAVIMSFMLISTSLATVMLVPEEAYREGGPAAGRVLAYLTHALMGPTFGTIYDISTILILWFAGSSAMAGLLNLIPRYLPRLGMAPRWVAYGRPLVLVLFAMTVLVTLVFRADVEAQAGAYATGVLALMLSGAVAVTLTYWNEWRAAANGRYRFAFIYFGIVSLVFILTLFQNIRERPDGLYIATAFIVFIVLLSALSRYLRATELRVECVTLEDAETEAIWNSIQRKKVNLVPVKHQERESLERKAAEIRQHYHVSGPLTFLHVRLMDDRSEFSTTLRVRISRLGDDYLIEANGAVAVANAIAYLSELLDPISIFLGLTRRNSVAQAFRYLLWGEGETGILVYEILRRHWEATPEEDVRPNIFLMSEEYLGDE